MFALTRSFIFARHIISTDVHFNVRLQNILGNHFFSHFFSLHNFVCVCMCLWGCKHLICWFGYIKKSVHCLMQWDRKTAAQNENASALNVCTISQHRERERETQTRRWKRSRKKKQHVRRRCKKQTAKHSESEREINNNNSFCEMLCIKCLFSWAWAWKCKSYGLVRVGAVHMTNSVL